MDFTAMSDRAIVSELGRRVQRLRLERNLTQQQIAERSGLSRPTVSDLERGKPFAMLTFIQVLRALDALDALDAFLPDPGISPLELARLKGRQRQRASRSRKDPGG